jgi:hypothetical protein
MFSKITNIFLAKKNIISSMIKAHLEIKKAIFKISKIVSVVIDSE